MKVIVPCCGRSTRYPNQPPKWMLPAHDGRPMIALATAGLSLDPKDLVVTILREMEEKYDVIAGMRQAFRAAPRVVILDEPTKSQAETVARTLEALRLTEPFLVKDSDNHFVLDAIEQEFNYVCVDSLNHYDVINPRNKSYLQVDHKDVVTNIREKVVISDLFSVGGYYFSDPGQFLSFFERLTGDTGRWQRELYISDVIGAMILEGIPFRARTITGYQDWGTVHEWRNALEARNTYFVLLDGLVLERGSEYFRPRFEDVRPLPEAVEALKVMADRGHSIIYLSIRPSSLSDLTTRQLKEAGVPEGQVVYNCPVAPWVLLTAAHPTLPFRTSHAFEAVPDDPHLAEKILRNR
jgi:dTDP-glucose pyrophosphorylase